MAEDEKVKITAKQYEAYSLHYESKLDWNTVAMLIGVSVRTAQRLGYHVKEQIGQSDGMEVAKARLLSLVGKSLDAYDLALDDPRYAVDVATKVLQTHEVVKTKPDTNVMVGIQLTKEQIQDRLSSGKDRFKLGDKVDSD